MRALLARVRGLLALIGRRHEAELEEEIRTHLDLLAEDHVRRGLPPDAARRAARRDFGSACAIRDKWRDQRGWMWCDCLRQDLRDAWRTFRNAPAFAAVAVVILAVAIAANTAIFTLVNALRWRPLPVDRPGELVAIEAVDEGGIDRGLLVAPFDELRRTQDVFADVFGWSGGGVATVEAGNHIGLVNLWAVTDNFHRALGVSPFAGRLFGPGDSPLDGTSGPDVAILGYRFWQRRFNGDPTAIGRDIRIEGIPFTVVGITRAGFGGMGLGEEAEVTVPLAAYPRILSGEGITVALNQVSLSAAGRVKPGVTIERARAALEPLLPDLLAHTVPDAYAGERRAAYLRRRLRLTSAATGIEWFLRTRFTRPLFILLGLVGLLALVAAVHLANAMLARAAARRREISVRLALGASRGRVARQLLTESLLLSAIGAAGAIPLAAWTSRWLAGTMTEQFLVVPFIDLHRDGRVLAATSAAAIVLGFLTGLTPAWFAVRRDPASALRASTTGGGRATRWLGGTLIAAQVALSLVVLTGAALLASSLQKASTVDDGIRGDNLLIATLLPRPGVYSAEGEAAYYRRLVERVVAVPGIDAAAVSLSIPGNAQPPLDEVAPAGGHETPVTAVRTAVSPGFFTTMGLPLVSGRDFQWADDRTRPPAAIVSRSLADHLFPGAEAVGSVIRVGTSPARQRVQIVGVAENARLFKPQPADPLIVYMAAAQTPSAAQSRLVVHGVSGVSVVRAAVTDAVDAFGRQYVFRTATYAEKRAQALVVERLTGELAAFFGGLALLLAAIGLYGVVSYAVTERTREIGIRLALGASPRSVRWQIVADGVMLVAVGVAAGVPLALATTHALTSLLFDVRPGDPAILAGVVIVLLATGALAAFIPARRASCVDPMHALRCE